jgi:hypothetical protein
MRRLGLLALLLAAALTAPARAAAALELGIADDRVLLGDPTDAAQVVRKWQDIGIESVRIHARWVAIAPAPHDLSPPAGFNAADANDPAYNWAALDYAIKLLHDAGIHPVLSITGSGPLWGSQVPALGNPRYKPDPGRFADFAYAVATRYRVDVGTYIIWNEPNQPGWLQPQFTCTGKRCTPASPHLYREIVRKAQPAIKAADPGAHVLIGALAPRGGRPVRRNIMMRPLTFIRALGCVDDAFHRVRTGPCRGFRPLRADGFAYHPHGVLRGPGTPNPNPDEAAIADLPRLERTLDKVGAAWGLRPTTGTHMGLYLTEFGYQTSPPDPYSGVAPRVQARWLQQAAYVAWRDPRVKCLMQYEWRDEPLKQRGVGSKAFASWQSGLLFADGRPKPALASFRNPFWIAVKRGRVLAQFWGQVRPSGAHTVTLLRRSRAGVRWTRVGLISTDARGYWAKRLPISGSADYRYTYTLPSGDPYTGPVTQSSAIVRVRARIGVVPLR